MKTCSKCKISINTNKKQCPLCFNELDGDFDEEVGEVLNTAKFKDTTAKKNYLLIKIFSFLSIVAISICLFINLLYTPKLFWSAVVILGILYVWVLVKHTIISNRGFFEKIFFQFGLLFVIVLSTNMFSGGEIWFWNFFAPSASLATTTALLFLLLINKKRSDFIVSSFVMTLLLEGMSIVLVCLPIDTFKLLNQINILYSGLFLLGILIFGFKALKRGLQKNLHI